MNKGTDQPRFSTKAVLQDFQNDGVVYLELRTTPRAMPAEGISKEKYVTTILDELTMHNSDAKNTMRAYLILSVDRRNTLAEAQEVVDLAIKYKSAGVVAVDLCGDPAKGDIRIFADAFARAKAAGLKITLHFAESEGSASDIELSTLLSWKPDRLGHVIHVKDEFQQIIERENIGVELCLSCNVHAKMITGTYSDHHFGMWRHTSVPVALSVSCIVSLAPIYILIMLRLTTLVCFAVLFPKNITLQRSISNSVVKMFKSFVYELLVASSLMRMRKLV